jgi:hypothetical protein
MTVTFKSTLAATGFAAAIGFVGVSASHAGSFGNAPWCAVQNLGAGDVVWDCEFPSAEACAPHVIAGNRGFCNINPGFVPPHSATPARHRLRRS